MGSKAFSCMNVAVIGNCGRAATLAEKLASAGHTVIIGLNENEDDDILISADIPEIYFDTIENAAAEADVIFLAVPAGRVRDMAYQLGDVRRKIIIDISGNFDPRQEQYSNTVAATKAITGARDVIKAYYLAPMFATDGNDVFFAGDSKKGKAVARIMANDLGFGNTHDLGDEDTIPLLEDMARCWRSIAHNSGNKNKIVFKIVKK